jgi:glycopeptide antibiotics resistance protein
MGKREVRIIFVRKRVTVALLILVSTAMLSLIWFLSGKAYSSEKRGPAVQVATLLRADEQPTARTLAALMPLLADVVAFVPWGFLMFLAVDAPKRTESAAASSRFRSYLLTVIAALLFAVAIDLWQYALPTRVTSFGDAIFNAAGALVGAVLAHLRRAVRIRFD